MTDSSNVDRLLAQANEEATRMLELAREKSEDLIRRDITVFGSWFCFTSEFSEMLALYRQGLPLRDQATP